MSGKKKYYKLDEIGILGKQEEKSEAAIDYQIRKTGEIFRKAKKSAASTHQTRLIKTTR
jgi:hypothetical protein